MLFMSISSKTKRTTTTKKENKEKKKQKNKKEKERKRSPGSRQILKMKLHTITIGLTTSYLLRYILSL